MTYILIILVLGHMPIQAEFSGYTACEKARDHIVRQIQAAHDLPGHPILVVSSGCYGRER